MAMVPPELLRVVPLKLRVRSATQIDGDAPMVRALPYIDIRLCLLSIKG